MKAATYEGNRRVAVRDGETRTPGPGEVRLDVGYFGICGTDLHIFQGHMEQRVGGTQILGHEAAGTGAGVGEDVMNVEVGDRVAVRPLRFGEPTPFDNGFSHVGKNLQFIGIDAPGGMQSSWTVPGYTLHRLPDDLSLQHGALIEPAAVACHDVRLANVQDGEHCVVIGGGPIGLLMALVARGKGGRVLLSEVNPHRIALAESLGFHAVNPTMTDLSEAVRDATGGAMADCVFEVSGSAAGVAAMTEVARVRGRIVLVAIHPQPRPVDLFRFFWSELQLIGARLYEPRDFDDAIALAAKGVLHLDRLITDVASINDVQATFERLDNSPDAVKVLIECA